MARGRIVKRPQGLTLIELLVALALAAALSAAMVATYANSRRNHFYEQQVARLQENGRHALRLLTRDLALAGFHAGTIGAPLPPAQPVAVDCADAPWALASDLPLEPVDDWAGRGDPITVTGRSLRCLPTADLAPGSDLLALRRTAAAPAQFLGTPAPSLTPSAVLRWYLRVEDGIPVRWEQLEARDIVAGRHSAAGVSLWPAVARIYSVQRGTGGVPQLCAETLAGNRMVSRCLVEGVEHLQIEYGVDTNGDGTAEQYLAAPAVGELPGVVAARVHLLLRSIRPVSGYSDRHPHTLGATRIPAGNDGYLRRVFSQTVVLGNGVQQLGRSS
ncbi:MAG: prepilin-type N-terminal cleavage/methylation domain-containing protein [Halioglobus sp.]|nr:prepilin-type N-terminal cleavage/methylation domain-containing protein [Halioglobus sp.]